MMRPMASRLIVVAVVLGRWFQWLSVIKTQGVRLIRGGN